MEVDAGSLSDPGRRNIIGQMVDNFNNAIPVAGVTAYLDVKDVFGSTGTIKDAAGTVWTSTTTDANGMVGYTPPLYYYVSPRADDYSRVWVGTYTVAGDLSRYLAEFMNITGRFTTTGGVASRFGFAGLPERIKAGVTSPAITVQRFDDFGNLTKQGQNPVHLVSDSLSLNRQFQWPKDNTLPDDQIVIQQGETGAQFFYYDEMSSYPSGEHGRPGQWTLRAQNLTVDAVGPLIVDPAETVKLSFDNPKSTQVAGKSYDDLGVYRVFELETHDQYDNPTISTTTSFFVNLSATRLPSATSDYFGFSLSSGTDASCLWTETGQVEISTNSYFVNFYYRDTRASDTYLPPGSLPLIFAQTTDGQWSGSQLAAILPDWIAKTAFTSAPQALTAGATSQAFVIETQDKYSNPSPVKSGQSDPFQNGVRFAVSSNSGGQKQFYTDYYGWQNTSGTVKVPVGSATTSFYLIDTVVGSYTLSADEESSRNWQRADQAYSVAANVPNKLVFITPPRRLVAGTTVQYVDFETGASTDTRMRVQVQDYWGNVSPVTGITNVAVRTTLPPVNPGAWASLDNISYLQVDPDKTPLSLTLSPGQSEAVFYFKAEKAGQVPVRAWITGLTPAVQVSTITPGGVHHFTIEHTYDEANPLSVQMFGPVTVQARDQYGNKACGDPINGNYYEGNAAFSFGAYIKDAGGTMFWQESSSMTVSLSTTSYAFSRNTSVEQPEPGRFINLQVKDTAQEYIQIHATDTVSSSVYGFTTDVRDASSGDVVTVGVVVTPKDQAPEADNPEKQGIGIAESLYQGDGTTLSRASAVSMIRLNLAVQPNVPLVTSSATWTHVTIKHTGTLAFDKIAEINIYKDTGDGMFNGNSILGDRTSSTDIFIASGTFSGPLSDLTMSLYNEDLGGYPVITKTPQIYFVCVRLPIDATKNSTLGLSIPAYGLTLEGEALLASNNMPTSSAISNIQTEPPKVYADIQDIAAWYDPDGVQGAQPLAKYATIPQGNPAVGMMRIGLWTPEYNALWNKITVSRSGTGSDNDVISCRIFLDDGSKTFQFGTDTPVSPEAIFSGGIARIDLQPQLLNQATKYYFIVYKMADSAQVDQTVGAVVTPDGFEFPDGAMAAIDATNVAQWQLFQPSGAESSRCTIVATADTLYVDLASGAGALGIGTVTQGDQNVPLLRMKLRTDARSVLWNGLRLDRRNVGGLNKDSDVSGIRIFEDCGVATLNQYLSETTTGPVRLTTTSQFGAAGFLYVGSEIMRYDAVLSSTAVNVPIGGRGIMNTAAILHTAGESAASTGNNQLDVGTDRLVSSSAQNWVFTSSAVVIPVVGPKGGQEIIAAAYNSPECKTYFVTFDIGYFATLGETGLGFDIKYSTHMSVVSPKQVNATRFPVSTQINRVQEYADSVTISPENSTIGGELMQGATNQPIISFLAETDRSEAYLNTLTVTRTGMAEDTDVTAVRIWYDGNRDSMLSRNTTDDWVIGEGYFNNVGNAGEAFITISSMSITLSPGNEASPDLWRKLTTRANATKRYWVTYDINDNSLPERNIGGRFAGIASFNVSSPNTMAATNLPFDSELRTLVPSGRNITMQAEPLNVASLTIALGPDDRNVFVDSVASFPDSGGLVVDSEILLYASRNPGNNSFGGVTRGAWNTVGIAHSTGTLVSRSYLQGTLNAPTLKLTASSDGFQVRWYYLLLNRIQPLGLGGNDSDVKAIKVWRDNGDGILNRDPSTGLIGSELLVSTGTNVFGNYLLLGQSRVLLAGDGKDSRNNTYVLITGTPTVYWVTMDIDQTAAKGSVIGAGCTSKDSVVVGAVYPDDLIHRIIDGPSNNYPGDPFPFRSGYAFVYATVDTLRIANSAAIPASINQNAQDVGVMRFTMQANQNTAIWQGLRLDLTGQCIDNDVTLVKVWKDLNNNGSFDETDRVRVDGEYTGLLSYGTENFSNKTATIMLKTPQVIYSTGTVNYFVTYTINSLAAVGNTVGLSLADTGYFIIDSPDQMEFLNAAPYETATVPIIEYPDTVVFEPWPWYDPANNQDVLAGVTITQGDTNVPAIKFRLKTDVSEAIWSRIRVERIGTGAPGQPASGSNRDVACVKIYADSNNTGSLDAGDQLISSGTDQFPADLAGPTVDITLAVPQTLRPSYQYYFITYDIALTAYANNSLGIRIKDRSWFTVSLPNNVQPFPAAAPFNDQGYFDSSVAQIQPLNISVQAENVAPLVKLPGDKDVPVLKLRFVPSTHRITVSSITVHQTGSIETSPLDQNYYFGIGDGDFALLRLWKDDGDGTFNAARDTLLSTLPHRKWVIAAGLDPNTVANYSGGMATLQCGTEVDTSGQMLFITADIGVDDMGSRTTFKHSAGLKLIKYDSLRIVPETAVSATSNAFPYRSVNIAIADVSISEVDVRPDKEGVQEVAWANSNTSMGAQWSIVKVAQANVRTYRAAIGSRPDTQDATLGIGSNGWSSSDKASIEIRGLALSEPVVVYLAGDLTLTATGSISVEYPDGHPKKGVANPTDSFDLPGALTIGKEIIYYTGKTANTFFGITRGYYGTPVEEHFKGTQVTNKAYFFKVKAETDLAGETPEKWGVVRIDLTAPSRATNVLPGPAKSGLPATEGKYEVTWDHAKDYESGVELYEVQEREDTNPVWKTIDVVAGDRFSTIVGDENAHDTAGNLILDRARAQGHFYYYRVRAKNQAGSWGEWSEPSAAAATSLPAEVITAVSNFPNPVDTRKGGEEAKTNIVYVLNQDAEVTITLYDLLGYQVNSWTYHAGEEGGRKGANRVQWDGANEMGAKVAKGGYIAQIRVKSDRGVVTTMRKIGVIH
ncbi:MAG: hypothetical protein ACYC5N_03680 [Endomicrobiales bacterium]